MLFMESDRIWNLITNPAWRPLTNADAPGYVVIAISAVVLVGLTIWTYVGAAQTTPRRLFLLVGLRLLALIIAILTALRPALSITDQPKQRSTLIIVLDASESMSVTDEYDKLSRWDVLRRNIDKCEPLLKQLIDDQEVTVHLYCFSTNFNSSAEQFKPQGDDKKPVSIADWVKSRQPDGKRTDFGQMLAELYKKYQGETNPIRGLIVVSDGGNNVLDPDANVQAKRWRGLNCPIYTFMVGKTDTKPDHKDIGFTSLVVDPSPVPVKADLTAKATLKAAGLEGALVKIKLTVSKRNADTKKWEEIPDLTRIDDFKLQKPTGNEIEIVTKAPDQPGQVRVTLEIIEGPAEDRIQSNNKIQTFVTVTKEGVRVLVIDRLRPELTYLRRALASDRRFDYVELVRQTDEPVPAGSAKKFDVLNEAYDVIILGDVSPARLNSLDSDLIGNIAKLVTDKGVGLIMTGGVDSFGGTLGDPGSTGWRNTPLAALLPVTLPGPTPQADGPTKILPLADAFSQYVMKLDNDPEKNRALWEELGARSVTRLGGYTRLGTPKTGATVYAKAERVELGESDRSDLLVGHKIGRNNARVLAFGADQTWKWVNFNPEKPAEATPESAKLKADERLTQGQALHMRFWRQIVLWLAHQDEVDGNVYVNATPPRLSVNGKTILEMGMKGKHGDEIAGPKMRYQILTADVDADEKKAKPAERGERGKLRGVFEPKEAREYRVVAWGEGTDTDGSVIKGEAEAWFDVYPDLSDELIDPAANDIFLRELENSARGAAPEVVRKADRLPSFVKEEFVDKPLRQTNHRPKLHPDWRRNKDNPWFLPLLLVGFVAVLALEWGLRRVWGMV
jgi:hypothetical protein